MYVDLLQQAQMLVDRDRRRPKQANLRRAVSAAYYALFHFLTDQATKGLLGTQAPAIPYRRVLARAFAHSDMKAACTSFAGGNLKATVSKGLPLTLSIPPEIRHLADTFVDLQSRRHMADYDLTERLTRPDVVVMIEKARDAIDEFTQLENSEVKKFFLACLLAWRTLGNR